MKTTDKYIGLDVHKRRSAEMAQPEAKRRVKRAGALRAARFTYHR